MSAESAGGELTWLTHSSDIVSRFRLRFGWVRADVGLDGCRLGWGEVDGMNEGEESWCGVGDWESWWFWSSERVY